MFIQPIDYFLAAWFVLALASTIYVGVDQFRNNPEPAVMKWGFILVTLYLGPIGLLLYVLADKEPRPGEHEEFIKPLWKQGIGSTIHCVAGDATGIIAAAVITAALGLPMWLDLIIEYLAGFTFGLLIFQALFMKNVMGGSFLQNVRRSFLPEFISMNFMMAGMAPVMTFLMMGRDMRAMDPTELIFWGVMSVGVAAGFALAYPANVWLVRNGLKHGLMTQRAPVSTKQHQGHPEPKAEHSMSRSGVTRSQLVAVAGIATLALTVGMIAPANSVNMTLSARDVGGLIMPPGMIMTRDTPAEAMVDMAAVDPNSVTASYGSSDRGDQVLAPTIENGVKVFKLTVSMVRWEIYPGQTVDAYAYNGQIPGPRLEFTQGDRVRVEVTNELDETTTVHWHGLDVPNDMDGPAGITQDPIKPGETYIYEYTVKQWGTYFYHSHDHADRQQTLGLYGAIVITPADPSQEVVADHDYTIQLGQWLEREGLTYPAMPMEGGLANYFTINGKSYPATETINMKVGETVKVRFIGTDSVDIHPMHIHGGPFTVVAVDGNSLDVDQRYKADTVNVGPGQRYDVIWTALEPGQWLIHCHINHHTTNNNVEMDGAGGLTMIITVTE
ncbi:MAG: multicopper oxidase domain-containing protein [Salinibacterium sp.]|nr:multicopper oxidase domain-containing protein [Salinibacterium sp.]